MITYNQLRIVILKTKKDLTREATIAILRHIRYDEKYHNITSGYAILNCFKEYSNPARGCYNKKCLPCSSQCNEIVMHKNKKDKIPSSCLKCCITELKKRYGVIELASGRILVESFFELSTKNKIKKNKKGDNNVS